MTNEVLPTDKVSNKKFNTQLNSKHSFMKTVIFTENAPAPIGPL